MSIPMKPFHSPFIHAIASMMALVLPSHADVEWKPLSLAQRGRFIELQRGEFARASSIVEILGEITLTAVNKTNPAHASSGFPLSLDGIKELKSNGRTALIRKLGRPGDKPEDFKFLLEVSIRVNNRPLALVLIQDEDPFETWDEREKMLKEAVASLDRLLEIASESEPPAPKDGSR